MPDEPLIIDDHDRYSRMRLIAWWDQQRLEQAKVMVVGIGALGNEVAKNLALMGVGQVFGIDMDCVEDSNLTRSVLFRTSDQGKPKVEAAARALAELNPDTRFYPIHGNVMTDVGLGLVRDMDVIIGCLDNREARLWVNRMCWKVGTPWIDGGIQEINGVAKVFVPPDGACYECAMTEQDYQLMNLRYSCPLLKREDILEGKVPTAPTISSIIAGLQTQEALKLIHDMPVAEGSAMVFNGLANNFYRTRYQHREDCLSHDIYPPPIPSGLSHRDTLDRIFGFARQALDQARAAATKTNPEATPVTATEPAQQSGLVLQLDRDLVESMECPACATTEEIWKPIGQVGTGVLTCSHCDNQRRPRLTHLVSEDSPLLRRPASDLAIPAYDILRFCSDDEEIVVELDGDRQRVFTGTPDRASASR